MEKPLKPLNAFLALFSAILFASAARGAEQAENLYEKGETWPETMVASRSAYLAWKVDSNEESGVALGPWHTTGPLKAKSFDQELFPERKIDLEAKDAKGNPLWTPRGDLLDGAVHMLPGGASHSTYLARTLVSNASRKLKAYLGSDDGCALWLNGEQLLARDVARGPAPDQDQVKLKVHKGENLLLFKIYNRGGHHGFYFAIQRDPLLDLWELIRNDFPEESESLSRDLSENGPLRWFAAEDSDALERRLLERVLSQAKGADAFLRRRMATLSQESGPNDPAWLQLYLDACVVRRAVSEMEAVDFTALRRALRHLSNAFPEEYVRGPELMAKLDRSEKRIEHLREAMALGDGAAGKELCDIVKETNRLRREILLANPLLDFEEILLVKRNARRLGLPQNWQGNCAMAPVGYDNEVALFSLSSQTDSARSLYKPDGGKFVGDVDLHFDGDKMLFSMAGSHMRWQIWEMKADGTELRQVTAGEEPDVDNYDACYLPDGRIVFASTRCFQGIPCVGGGNTVANLCIMDSDGSNARQLCFDQDHNWCPTVLNNGRVLYSRWEYSDTPHYFSRLLFHMNPDGTGQSEFYGSNSYWPNSIFYARPVPNHPSRVVAVISGHHGVPRMGELILFDPARGRFEADGVVQRIPGYGKKVEPVIADQLVNGSWPRFLHPYPLSDKFFLVSCQPSPDSLWGLYLADVFDNLLLLAETPGYALLEPIPLRPTQRPPAVPDKVRLDRDDATVYLVDVYFGNGLAGVPKGSVKKLRLYEFHYCYPKMGGHINVGVEAAWDVHRILGTVPVEEDGSALFHVPANMPIAVQPLDEKGRALQIMRSWFVAMPGETLSCIGCHERQNAVPPGQNTLASKRAPAKISPWYGPARGFSFKREVQPVLNKHCAGCHDGSERPDGGTLPDLRAKEENGWRNFTPSYLALHPFVRRPGPESDYHLQAPLEFHASTSELVQMLEKGHHGATLDEESWDRLFTWIDLNVPDHGTWGEHRAIFGNFHERRIAMRTRYANRPEDPEKIYAAAEGDWDFVKPAGEGPRPKQAACQSWPFDEAAASLRQVEGADRVRRMVDLGEGVSMELARIPAGTFVMGSARGTLDETPPCVVNIEKPFWIGVREVTNAQFTRFDGEHHNGYLDQHHKDHNVPGYPVDGPDLPAIRLSWEKARAFCGWLSQRTGETFTLPTEAQWEWACRAGSQTPLGFGQLDSDFSKHANLADFSTKSLALHGVDPKPIANPDPYMAFIPCESRFNDGEKIMCGVGKYEANAWGLHDMHGNVAEWTSSLYRPYPYDARDGREDPLTRGKRVVRGGSWRDRPHRATSSYRVPYAQWQRVFNVGFRVVCSEEPSSRDGRVASAVEP